MHAHNHNGKVTSAVMNVPINENRSLVTDDDGFAIVHYTARFADGIVFDSSYKRGRPLTMRLGLGKVIKGLDQGILGDEGVPPMLVGGKRKLQIPPELAYGPELAGCFSGDCNIPANATLVYDINFVDIYKENRKQRSSDSYDSKDVTNPANI